MSAARRVVVAELRAAYARFEQQLETLATLEPADIPEAARTGSAELPADAVIVHVTRVGVTAYPPQRVLYYLNWIKNISKFLKRNSIEKSK